MDFKKRGIVLAFLLIVLSVSVSAQLSPNISSSLGRALGMIGDVFTLLSDVVYMKILIWILVFALLNMGAKLIKLDNKTAGIVSFVVSLMGVLLIPPSVVQFLFAEYSFVVMLILFLVPVIVMYVIQSRIGGDNRLVRVLVLLFLALLTWALANNIRNGNIPRLATISVLGFEIAGVLDLFALYFFIAAIFNMFVGVGTGIGAGIGAAGRGLLGAAGDFVRGRNDPQAQQQRLQNQQLRNQQRQQQQQQRQQQNLVRQQQRIDQLLNRVQAAFIQMRGDATSMAVLGNRYLTERRAEFRRVAGRDPVQAPPDPVPLNFNNAQPNNTWRQYMNIFSRTTNNDVNNVRARIRDYTRNMAGASQAQQNRFTQLNNQFLALWISVNTFHNNVMMGRTNWQPGNIPPP